jgi:hypothetical protein
MAKVERAERAELATAQGRIALKGGEEILEGQSLDVGVGGSAAILFPDRTRLEIGPESELGEFKVQGGKRIRVAKGTVLAEVAKQVKDQPMIFATPQGQATVLGTTLRILVDLDPKKGTRVEVEEGKVEFKESSGKAVIVESGHLALSAEGAELVTRALPIEDILLLPRQGKLIGAEWKLVKDRAAGSDQALECRETSYKIRKVGSAWVYDSVKTRSSYILYSFNADAGKDYCVWIRGRSLPEDANRLLTSELAVEFPAGQTSLADAQPALKGDNVYSYTGFFHFPGYGWIGGRGEDGKSDAAPLRVRFAQPGRQTLKVYVLQAPAWIDAVWLSPSQKIRPEPGQSGPTKK